MVAERLQAIRARIEAAASRVGRDPSSITLVAVAKGQPAAAVREAFEAGARVIGENYVQEMLSKQAELTDLPIEWHFIGALQSNKARQVVSAVSTVQSVDRGRLVQELSKRAMEAAVRCGVLIEVNVGAEQSKSGVSPEGVLSLAAEIAEAPGLQLQGLMAIPQPVSRAELARPAFAKLRALADGVQAAGLPGVQMNILSMGMSSDFEIAIEEGATHVRVGTAIFGARPPR